MAYYQTIIAPSRAGSPGRYVDPMPLAGTVTDINLGAIHLNASPGGPELVLNEDPPDASKYERLWRDVTRLQSRGIRVNAFVGGAAKGSYRNLAADPDAYYRLLKDFLVRYRLDGVDLDIEEPFSLDATVSLVSRLRADFGADFVVTLAPVATDLAGSSRFSGGFSYADLEQRAGGKISWYNAQFYCGWGDLADTADYDGVIGKGFPAAKIVAGTVTDPTICKGFVKPAQLVKVIGELNDEHSSFGGVFGFEYRDAVAGPRWFTRVEAATTSR